MSIKGIDVSAHNGTIDWQKVKAAGIAYAVIRIGYGSDIKDQDDSTAINNMKECEKLGIPYGVYLYSYALNENDAKSEAAHALRMVEGFNPALGIWFDMEDADGYKAEHSIDVYKERELLTGLCKIFCEAMLKAGYKTGVYANKNYFDNVLLTKELEKYDKWLAHWGVKEPSMPCTLWQYTSDGSVDGVPSERVDMNYYYGELPKIEEPKKEEIKPANKYAVGQHITFTQCYSASTDADSKAIPASKMARNHGIITKVLSGKKNPYLLDDGMCWVNDASISGLYNTASKPVENKPVAPTATIAKGDKVRVLKAVTYTGGSFRTYHDTYDVIQVKGDRAVIGRGKAVTAAINVKNIALVKKGN